MCDENRIVLFYKLPQEIVVKILSSAKTYDVIQFCKAYPCYNHLLNDKKVLRSVDFASEYQLRRYDFKNFMCQERLSYIQTLNISNVYWISLLVLHVCIKSLCSLKKLFAFDTPLGLTREDCLVYSQCSQLEILAVNAGNDCSENLTIALKLSSLRRVYIYVTNFYTGKFNINYFSRHHNNLERFWIFDENMGFPRAFYLFAPHNVGDKAFRNFLDLTCMPRSSIPNVLFETGYFWTKVLYRLKSCNQILWTPDNVRLMQFIPFGVNDVFKLFGNVDKPMPFYFEELDFSHPDFLCYKKFNNFIDEVLLSPGTSYLKKLVINFCVCQGEMEGTSPFQNIVANCRFLEELDIISCLEFNKAEYDSLERIMNFKQLKKLSLIGVPEIVQGSFLMEVVRSCENLKFLSVKIDVENRLFCENFYSALEFAVSLEDLRVECDYLSFNQIFRCLNAKKIQRIFLKSDQSVLNEEKEELCALLENFLIKNPNVVFVMLWIKGMTDEFRKMIQRLFHTHRKDACQVFRVVADENITWNIPAIHKFELVDISSKVGVYNFFERYDL